MVDIECSKFLPIFNVSESNVGCIDNLSHYSVIFIPYFTGIEKCNQTLSMLSISFSRGTFIIIIID